MKLGTIVVKKVLNGRKRGHSKICISKTLERGTPTFCMDVAQVPKFQWQRRLGFKALIKVFFHFNLCSLPSHGGGGRGGGGGSGRAVPQCRHIGCVVSHGAAAMSCCMRVNGTRVTCAGCATMTSGGGGHWKVCRGTCHETGKLFCCT